MLRSNYLLTLLLGFLLQVSFAQKSPEFFLHKDAQPVPILLVGTFHFGYPGMDSHKTKPEDKIDVLSSERQEEMNALVDYIARFKPTKIVVEAGRNTGYLMKRYARWQNGTYDLKRQEIDQLAFPLMKQFDIDTLYGCDAPSFLWSTLYSEDSMAMQPVLNRIAEVEKTKDPMEEQFYEWYSYTDQYTLNHTLLETFQLMNKPHNIQAMHGHYLIGAFKRGEFEGADELALNWYSRNLRIFRLIQRIDAGPEDRVMVLFGAGHMAILAQQFTASPGFEVVPFDALGDIK